MLTYIKTNKTYYWSILALAGPIIISQIGHTLVQTADSIIIGHFAGTIPLAAASLAHAVFFIVLVLGLGISFGLTPLIAQANGKGNKVECGKLLSNSFWINLVSAFLLFIIVYYGSFYAVEHAGQDPEVVKVAKPYLFLLALSIFPLMVFNTFKQFAEGLGFTKQAMQITIWGNIINIALAIVFVKGMFGIKPMGISGVGLATLIDRVLMMLAMILFVIRSKHFKSYITHLNLRLIQKKRIKAILRIGTPVAFQYVFEVSAFAGASILTGKIGALEQASHNVALTLASMAYMAGSGIAAATTIKVGTSFGRGNMQRLEKYAKVSYQLVILFMIVTACIFATFNQYLPFIITKDQEVVLLASQLLIIAGLFQLFDGTQVIGLGILRGIGDVNVPTLLTFFAYWIVGIPSGYIMGITLNWGAKGVWYGLTLGLMTSTILLHLRYRHIKAKQISSVKRKP